MADDIQRTLGKIEGGIQAINDKLDKQNGRLDEAEEDIVKLRVRDAKVAGGLGALVTGMGAFLAWWTK